MITCYPYNIIENKESGVKMSQNAHVIVFPGVFAQNKIPQLVSNIKKILKIQNQGFDEIKTDGSVIVVKANDPVFASSTINLLFGIRMVAIAKTVKNDFNSIVDEISKVGTNLLLKGERFYVKVEGNGIGFVPKDVELAATSSLIEKTSNMETKPGSEEDHDKLLYTYLTKSNAYVCIFSDGGLGGIPNNWHNTPALCCIFDELSAVSCLETIKEGFTTKILVFYNKEDELLILVKMINQIIPRLLLSKISFDFFKIPIKIETGKYLQLVDMISEILIKEAKRQKISHISLPLSPLLFPSTYFDKMIQQITKNNLVPIFPLSGLDDDIFKTAKSIGLEKFLTKLERFGKIQNKKTEKVKSKIDEVIKSRKTVSIVAGPKNVHDILDSLKIEH